MATALTFASPDLQRAASQHIDNHPRQGGAGPNSLLWHDVHVGHPQGVVPRNKHVELSWNRGRSRCSQLLLQAHHVWSLRSGIMAVFSVTFVESTWCVSILLLAAVAILAIRNKYKVHLRDLPGPLLAGCTNFWMLYDAALGTGYTTQLRLHHKYKSSLIRIGPHTVSVSDPDLIPQIYGFAPVFTKSDFYQVFRIRYNGQAETDHMSPTLPIS